MVNAYIAISIFLRQISIVQFSKIIKNDIHLTVSSLGGVTGTAGACLPVSFAPYLIQIRWIWTDF
jgi:hypothetical protein